MVEFPSTPWEFHTDTSTLPFTVSDVMIMRDGEYNGSASNTVHPHLEIGWVEAVAGANFDLAKIGGPHPPPFSTSQDNVDYGAFVTALLDQEIFSVGWKADVPAGQVVGVNIYDAAGIARGALITSGTVVSPKGGMRWHDVPIGASLAAGQDYDIEIDMNGVTTWRYWTDTAGPNPVPYDVFGSLRVVDSESGGGAGNNALIEMRVHACHATATSVPGDRPGTAPPSFALRAPYPNPVSGVSTVEYSLDEAGPVTIQVYDVRGRRVATLLNENRPAGFGSVAIQARSMPAGVYFVKMATNLKTVSRKVTIVR